ncbi:MAG: hypothetical protein OEM91_14170, partial [Hyphomicrobiales bacterium]|nr:hypothetical protein [Hyphomicrobiales bacterium]
MTADADTGKLAEMRPAEPPENLSLFGRIGNFLKNVPDGELIAPTLDPAMLNGNVRIAWDGQPFGLTLGNVTLEFHPDLAVTGNDNDGIREWIIHAGRAFYDGVPSFMRVAPGETVILGRDDDVQRGIFGLNKSVADRHVKVSNRRGELTIQPMDLDRKTKISALESPVSPWEARRKNLKRLPKILGHPLTQFGNDEAHEVIREVNAIMAAEVYRDPDDDGAPGGIIRFPDDMTVVILGDVHTRAENVLRVLTEGGLLAA